MTIWVKQMQGDELYHWCKNCPQYPKANEVILQFDTEPIKGPFCSICKSLERENKCR